MTVPPRAFIAGLVQLPMMPAAKGDCKFIADLKPHRPRLRKAQMVGIGWLAAADQVGLAGDIAQVVLIAIAQRLADRETGLLRRFGGARR